MATLTISCARPAASPPVSAARSAGQATARRGAVGHSPAACSGSLAVRGSSQAAFSRGAKLGAAVRTGGRNMSPLSCRAQGSDDAEDYDEPYDYDPYSFHQAALHYVEVEPSEGTGTLLFTRVEEEAEEETRCLTLKIGGDTMFALLSELGHDTGVDRPMTVNLLWKVLQRGAKLASRTSKLLFVAIVGTTDDQVFLGRLFFGDANTGEVHWDCDCRPSDAAWLSLKEGCAVMVHDDVWDDNSISYDYALETMNGLKEMSDAQLEDDATRGGDASVEWEDDEDDRGGLKSSPLVKSKYEFTAVREDDPVEVTRLKRELEIAVKEEDYAQAKRIRDHPFMKMYADVMRLRKEEKLVEALEMSQDLINLIQLGDGESTLAEDRYFKGHPTEHESN